MFQIASIIGIVVSLIVIALHLVMRSAVPGSPPESSDLSKPSEPAPVAPGTKGMLWRIIYFLIYLAAGGSFAILALSGFIAAIGWGGPMHGYLLMLHCTVAPVFCVALVALGCIWAERFRFRAEDLNHCTMLCCKLCFWSVLLFGIPLMFSIVVSMLPIFGTCGQEFFYHMHRWSALAIVCTGLLMIYLAIVSRRRFFA